jgi:hypothetical protein
MRIAAVNLDEALVEPVEARFDPGLDWRSLQGLYAVGGADYAAATGTVGESYRWWTATRGGDAQSVPLEGAVRADSDRLAVGPDGAAVLLQSEQIPDSDEFQSVLRVQEPDGRVRWVHDFGRSRQPDWLFGPVVGRDGQVVVVGVDRADATPSHVATSIIYIFGGDGTVEHATRIPDVTLDGSFGDLPLLAADGTLYFAGGSSIPPSEPGDALIAVQTPVAGRSPQDRGSSVLGRDNRQDGWGW